MVPKGPAGWTHDVTAARPRGIILARLTRQILSLADRAYQGAGVAVPLPPATANNQSTASSSTVITPACGHPVNAPRPARNLAGPPVSATSH